MRVNISDKLSLMLTEQGFTYSNWLHIQDDVAAVVETGLNEYGLQGVKPERIDLVINSHHHLDHTRGNRLFSRAKVMIHEKETVILKNEEQYLYHNSADQWDALMPGADFEEAALFLGVNDEDQPFRSSREVIPLRDGQIIDFGTVRAEVLHTPGHSIGHCCFWFPNEEFLFSSDICLTAAGPWYGEHCADPADMMDSIDRIIALKPPRMVSSHMREPITDPLPRLKEFKSRIGKREERIYDYLRREPSDLHRLAAAKLVYHVHPTEFVVFWEKLMLLKHIERLQEQGRVKREGDVYYGV
ncbi:MAG: MBL fold metallo-hydrolase [Syntrophomonadaceae bacterium]|nr:MBL fold metallo-hydrolase [Syntrophomonadaceae bacterium]